MIATILAAILAAAPSGTTPCIPAGAVYLDPDNGNLYVCGTSWTSSGPWTLTSWTLSIANGGTGATTATAAFDALAPTTTQGDTLYHDGADNVRLAAGSAGQLLRTGGAGANPSWVARPSTHIGYRSVADTAVAKADGNATVTTLTNWNTTLDDLGAVTPISLDGFANIRIIVRGNNTAAQVGTVTTEIWNYTTAAQLVQVTFTSTTIATYANTAAIALTGVHVLGCRLKSSVATDDPQMALCAFEVY